MQITRIAIVALIALAACGVEAIDYTQKTCPCPSGLVCDTSTNHCFDPGTLDPQSQAPPCTPKSCLDLGAECGAVANDGCGHGLDCGKCVDATDQCVGNTCQCIPAASCAAVGAECGSVPNGCPMSDPLTCPACPADKPNCGGGGGPNKCGTAPCTKKTACDPGQCGTVSDGCGGTITCPSDACTGLQTCGGGGTANQCGCTGKTCAQLGFQCGRPTDNCGNQIDCGGCTGGKVCNYGNHTCQCATCGGTYGWQCGSGADGCGGTLNCGGCSFGVCQSNHQCDN